MKKNERMKREAQEAKINRRTGDTTPPPQGCRYTALEAKAILALLMSVGTVSRNGLSMFSFIGKKRANELEKMKPNKAEQAFFERLIKEG